MPPPLLRQPPLWLQAALLFLAAGLVTAFLYGRLGWSDWTRPHWLQGDPLEVYARVKIAAEQPGHALFSFTAPARLGAPAVAGWTGYPVPDRLVFVLTGLLARAVGVIAAVNLAGAAIAGLNTLSFYLCARWLRWRWEWAAALGLVFAFSAYSVRWGVTLSFSQVFILPPLILLCARASRGGLRPPGKRSLRPLAAALGVWLGFANPYLALFAGVVAGGALLLGLVRRAPPARRAPLLWFLGILAATFLASNVRHLAALLSDDATTSLVRSADDARVYALRPADWIVPPADHRVRGLALIGRDYLAAHHGTGEFFYNYLGLAGLFGFGVMIVQLTKRLARRRWPAADPLLGIAWITAFGIAGGVNTWLATAGLDHFRAGSRIGVYALVWVLLQLGGWLSRRSGTWPRRLIVPLAGLLAVAAIWEQTPSLADSTGPAKNLVRWEAMSHLTRQLERELPTGAMVFQLPSVPFPEAGPCGAMTDYEHFLPFLTSHSLRFSYGQLRSSPWLRWSDHLARAEVGDLVRKLESAGFAALWIDRRAYADSAQGMIDSLQILGRQELTSPGPDVPVQVIRLHPAPVPTLPDLTDPRLNEAWEPKAGNPDLFAVEGWYPAERSDAVHWRWAQRRATTGYWREGPAAEAVVRFRIGGPAGSVVVLRKDDREIWRGVPSDHPVEARLQVSPGFNRFEWTLEGRLFRPGGSDSRQLGFMVENLSLSVP